MAEVVYVLMWIRGKDIVLDEVTERKGTNALIVGVVRTHTVRHIEQRMNEQEKRGESTVACK